MAYAKAYASKPELPPRARRIPEDILAGVVESGTTSACAENTSANAVPRNATRNYLRVRGEYMACCPKRSRRWELPPRARRILGLARFGVVNDGTTSACAENTGVHHPISLPPGNYLRVRGEYWIFSAPESSTIELPPRARRILAIGVKCLDTHGTTSACAENTLNELGLL